MPARIGGRKQAMAGMLPPLPPTVYAVSANGALSLTIGVASQRGAPVTAFALYRATAAGGQGTTPVATVPVTAGQVSATFSDTGLTNGTTYFYVARAISAAGMSAAGPEMNLAPSATVNLLSKSGSLANANTNAFGTPSTLTAGATDPNGDASAFRLQASNGAGIQQDGSPVPTNGLQSVWVKSNTGASQSLQVFPANNGAAQTLTATTAWQRLAFQIGAQPFNIYTQSGQSADILLWHPQLEDLAGTTPSTYAGT